MARRKKVRPIDLSAAIQELLQEYGNDVYNVVGESVDEVTDEALKKLRAINHWKNEGTGAYAGSWVQDDVKVSRIEKHTVIHNEEHYRLTHLLENGHAIKNGTGRTYGKTGKYPHIAPVNDWANEELPRRFKRKLEAMR